jgi:NDP-sugar pyrophosphorylase family protein
MDIKETKVIKFREKKEVPEVWMNAGIYHLKKEVLKDLPKKGDIEKTVFTKYANKGLLNTMKFRKIDWYSIDSLKDIEECSLNIMKIIK